MFTTYLIKKKLKLDKFLKSLISCIHKLTLI